MRFATKLCGPFTSCRYDDLKSASENIDFQSTILSRCATSTCSTFAPLVMHRYFVHGSFDLIFIVRDVRDEARDQKIAEHVIQVGGCVKP
jgi:DNA replication licensing factor MCM5